MRDVLASCHILSPLLPARQQDSAAPYFIPGGASLRAPPSSHENQKAPLQNSKGTIHVMIEWKGASTKQAKGTFWKPCDGAAICGGIKAAVASWAMDGASSRREILPLRYALNFPEDLRDRLREIATELGSRPSPTPNRSTTIHPPISPRTGAKRTSRFARIRSSR